MKNLLEYILIRLVEYPEEVKVTETVEDNGTILYTITANEEDYGRIIGKGGAVISSIRNIIRVRAVKEGKRAIVKVDAEPKAPVEQEPQTVAEEYQTPADQTVAEMSVEDFLVGEENQQPTV